MASTFSKRAFSTPRQPEVGLLGLLTCAVLLASVGLEAVHGAKPHPTLDDMRTMSLKENQAAKSASRGGQPKPPKPLPLGSPFTCPFDPYYMEAELGARGGPSGSTIPGDWVDSEFVPYTFDPLQGSSASAQKAAQLLGAKNPNVEICVLSDGINLPASPELQHELPYGSISGCLPSESNSCKHAWYTNLGSPNGASTLGVLAALRNGRGMVGMASAGARIRICNDQNSAEDPLGNDAPGDTLKCMQWCVQQLDVQKKTNPLTKQVIIVTRGILGYTADEQDDLAKYAAGVAEINRRGDVLIVAGSAFGETSLEDTPSMFPGVVAVAFYNAEVNSFIPPYFTPANISALPGGTWPVSFSVSLLTPLTLVDPSQRLVRTGPVWEALYALDQYPAVLSARLTLKVGTRTFWAGFPKARMVRLSPIPKSPVSGKVVDCTSGDNRLNCKAAAGGNICLIDNSNANAVIDLCQMVLGCKANGGAGAIVIGSYPRIKYVGGDCWGLGPYQDFLPPAKAGPPDFWNCGGPYNASEIGYVPAIGLSIEEGNNIKALVNGNETVMATISANENKKTSIIGYTAGVGGNMAHAGTAGGAVALTWATRPECPAAAVKAALEVAPKARPFSYTDATKTTYPIPGYVQVADAIEELKRMPCK